MTLLFGPVLAWILAQAPAPAAGAIGGRITDQQTGAPIARAAVQLNRVPSNEEYKALTDETGGYLIANLPPGEYRGLASGGPFKAMYLTEILRLPSGPTTIVVKADEARTDINVALPRAAGVTVHVVDERGDPLSNVEVTAKAVTTGMTMRQGWRNTTDDLGRRRLFNLSPGRYVICAGPSPLAFSESPPPRRDKLLRTCYPDTQDEARAEAVTIGQAGAEDIQIRLRRGRAITISGTALDASGAPLTGFVLQLSTYFNNGSGSRSIPLDPDGRFRLADMMPGDYAIEASVGGRLRPEQARDLELAYVPLHVDTVDIDGLVIRTFKAPDVNGRFVFEDLTGAPPPIPGPGLMVFARLAGDPIPGQGSSRTATADKTGAFTLEGMFGRRLLDVANVPNGWFVKSIRHGEEDTTVTAADFTNRTGAIEIILSRRGAILSGRVLDDGGRPLRGARVVAFTVDRTMWTVHRPQGVSSSPDGSFRLGPMRGGDYFVVALPPGIVVPDSRDGDRFAALAAGAERISIDHESQQTMDLRVFRPK